VSPFQQLVCRPSAIAYSRTNNDDDDVSRTHTSASASHTLLPSACERLSSLESVQPSGSDDPDRSGRIIGGLFGRLEISLLAVPCETSGEDIVFSQRKMHSRTRGPDSAAGTAIGIAIGASGRADLAGRFVKSTAPQTIVNVKLTPFSSCRI